MERSTRLAVLVDTSREAVVLDEAAQPSSRSRRLTISSEVAHSRSAESPGLGLG